MSTTIQWTDVTDNIIVAVQGGWWCRKISPGCANCYAAKLNQNSFYGGNHLPYTGESPPLKLRTELLESWKRQRQPKKHFVASMTDVFGEWVPRDWIFQFMDAMSCAPDQTFQVLTKRADVMNCEVTAWLKFRSLARVPENIWLGVSVEDSARAVRLTDLMKIPAIRFASFEPLLEGLDFCRCWLSENTGPNFECEKCGKVRLMLDWAIIGGESGPGARACNIQWMRNLMSACSASGVATFVKQLGAVVHDHTRHEGTVRIVKLHDKKGGDMAEWPEDLRVRNFPPVARGGLTT